LYTQRYKKAFASFVSPVDEVLVSGGVPGGNAFLFLLLLG
jgi:hypothetical protein